jgi:putative hemolysin
MAVVSVRRARLQHRAAAGDRGARLALELANTPQDFLATVQIGITLVGILAGALAGATLAEQIGVALSALPLLAPYAEAIGLAIVVAAITYLSLVLGELVPKRLALSHADAVAPAVAAPMKWLSRAARPAVKLLALSTDAVLALMRIAPRAEPAVTAEEIEVLIEQGAQAGTVESAERAMLASIFRLGERRVGHLMTPRTEIAFLDGADSVEEIQSTFAATPHGHYPLIAGTPDNVVGVVRATDLLARCLAGQPPDLRLVARAPLYLPEGTPALRALELFKASATPMALVIDEHGGLQGLVTLTDVLEAIVGEIPQRADRSDLEIVQREDGSWLVDGLMGIDRFKERFGLRELPGEREVQYQTLGGFVMTALGRVPATGDRLQLGELSFEVVDMDGHRVDKVLVAATTPSRSP